MTAVLPFPTLERTRPTRRATTIRRPVVTMTELDRRFAAGDERALGDAYAEHGSLIYSYCRRRLDDEVAREVTQDVFVSAWKARERFDPLRGSLRTWLMAITKNRIIDAYRKQSRRPQTVAESDDGPMIDEILIDDTPTEIERTADRMVLAQAIRDLPDRPRQVVELSFFAQLTHPEIVEKTGLPLGTVKSDIRRSLIKLKRALHHEEVDDV